MTWAFVMPGLMEPSAEEEPAGPALVPSPLLRIVGEAHWLSLRVDNGEREPEGEVVVLPG